MSQISCQDFILICLLIFTLFLLFQKNMMSEVISTKAEPFKSTSPPNTNCCSQSVNRFNINTMPFKKPIGYNNLFSTTTQQIGNPYNF